ncbi:MAG: hypothetical protein AAF242_01505 [Bacteroidota bacterium]
MIAFDHYLQKANADLPQANLDVLDREADLKLADVLKIEEKNRLLNKGYLPAENGFYHFEDGSAYAAVYTPMPKVSIEMIDWWFWWHAKTSVRYQIWYPQMHYSISADFQGHYDDDSKSYRERLHLSQHTVEEDIGTGKEKILIDFLSPKDFGFDPVLLDNEQDLTIICAGVGDLEKRVWHTKMCHQVRKMEVGVEMRSRFWLAQKVERMDRFLEKPINFLLNQPLIKKKLLPKKLGKYMFHHCTQEYNNLNEILPEIYEKVNK